MESLERRAAASANEADPVAFLIPDNGTDPTFTERWQAFLETGDWPLNESRSLCITCPAEPTDEYIARLREFADGGTATPNGRRAAALILDSWGHQSAWLAAHPQCGRGEAILVQHDPDFYGNDAHERQSERDGNAPADATV